MGSRVLLELQKIILGVILVVLYASLLTFILLTLPYRALVIVVAKICRPELGSMITDLSSVFSLERPEESIFNLMYFVIIDGNMPTDRFRDLFQRRIMNRWNARGDSLVFYRLREGWDYFLGYTFWRPDPNFDLNYYIRDYDYEGKLALPCPCYEEHLRRVCSDLTQVCFRN
ncbi:unnamed protein product [Allacma fusca]|uniref:Uncharacterized protein n=1 Tax=Allacma fusca TaxID=39272 RepID=A0A8J2P4Z0_9HEXA|nr:unnamed protein product [Allacma fusca]